VLSTIWRPVALSGSERGASAVVPAPPVVVHGTPSGSRTDLALCTGGTAAR
jgi:hypothetical protein